MPFTFANPWWLIALPLLIPLFFLNRRVGAPSSITYSSLSILEKLGKKPKLNLGAISFALIILALACIIIALARPQINEHYTERKASGVDIILAIDISYSMEIFDFKLDGQSVQRITVAKATAENFIRERPHDRIGIIAFSGRPYVTSPITLEHDWLIEEKLRELKPGLIQEQGTAIGSAIAEAATRLYGRESKSKVIVLVTDGSNNSGPLSPIEAAKHAAKLGVKIYAIAIGTEEGRLYNGRQAHPQQEFDTETLEKIAKITHGEYFRVKNTDKLRETFQSIDQLEKTDIKQQSIVTSTEFFPWFAAAALIFTLIALTLQAVVPPPAP